MRNLPVVLDGYRLTVVDPPAPKVREDENGNEIQVTDQDGAVVFVVSLFAKQRVQAGQRAPKGEEIKVTLATDPGMGFDEDVRVELVSPVINHYVIESGGRTNAGLAFKATGMKLAGNPAPARKSGGKPDASADENAA